MKPGELLVNTGRHRDQRESVQPLEVHVREHGRPAHSNRFALSFL